MFIKKFYFLLKNNKIYYKTIRFSTLEAICKNLECPPGDILEYVEEQKHSHPHQQNRPLRMAMLLL
ncbi:helix-turn-helix domain-containing protein [Bacillus sp. XF8]|nr:helix-turn-helix domain-containing protein [Bacillus sp. XF8]